VMTIPAPHALVTVKNALQILVSNVSADTTLIMAFVVDALQGYLQMTGQGAVMMDAHLVDQTDSAGLVKTDMSTLAKIAVLFALTAVPAALMENAKGAKTGIILVEVIALNAAHLARHVSLLVNVSHVMMIIY